MKVIAIGCVLLLSVLVGSNCQMRNDFGVKAVEVFQNFPIIDSNGNLSYYDTSRTKIYFYNRKILVSPSKVFRSYKNGKMVDSSLVWNYFVFEKESKTGYFYDLKSIQKPRKCDVDSFLNEQYSFFNHTKRIEELRPKLFSESYNEVNKTVLLSFTVESTFKDSMGNRNIDTLELFFDKKLEYSNFRLSKYLDSLYNSKLTCIVYKTPPKYFSKAKVTVAELSVFNSFKEIKVENVKNVMKYFNSL
jgi:hypothetical protein